MSDADTRARVLRDYALTISDLIADNHYGHLNQLAKDNGLIFYSEAAGPNYDWADLLKTSSRVDMAMAEFWMPSAHRPTMDSRFLLRNAANANHIYGKNITMCESFTSLGPEWEETPFDHETGCRPGVLRWPEQNLHPLLQPVALADRQAGLCLCRRHAL